jgi:hypothetical protein
MSWNYRLILHDLDPNPDLHWVGLHEVYYGMPDDSKKPGIGWTKDAISFVSSPDDADTIKTMLKMALKTLNDPEFSEVIKESEYEKHKRPSKDNEHEPS